MLGTLFAILALVCWGLTALSTFLALRRTQQLRAHGASHGVERNRSDIGATLMIASASVMLSIAAQLAS